MYIDIPFVCTCSVRAIYIYIYESASCTCIYCIYIHSTYMYAYTCGFIPQCCKLLDSLGVPYLQSQGEAEALCSVLNYTGVSVLHMYIHCIHEKHVHSTLAKQEKLERIERNPPH